MSPSNDATDARARNKATARRFYAAIEACDEKVLAEICAPGARFNVFGQPLDFAGHMQLTRGFSQGFPGGRMIVDEMVAEGDRVISRAHYEGVHGGLFQGVAPTGRKIRLGALGFHRFSDGRITEHHGHADAMGLMVQIGAVPPAA